VRIHTRIDFKPASALKATNQARTFSQDDAAARVAEYEWRRLDVDAFSASGFIHERHDLRAPAGVRELVIPLTYCIPRSDTPAVDLAITGSPQVFDGRGPLKTELILPSKLGG
jgi:hypothetical protein